jgi:hypothetical protein
MAAWESSQREATDSSSGAAVADLRRAASELQRLAQQDALAPDEIDESATIARELVTHLERARGAERRLDEHPARPDETQPKE